MKKPKKFVAFMLAALMVGNSTFTHIPEIRAADEASVDGDTSDQAGDIGDGSGDTDNTDNAGDTDNSGDTDNAEDTDNSDDADNAEDTDNSGDTDNAEDTVNSSDMDNAGDTDNAEDTDNSGDTDNTGDADNAGDTDNTVDTENSEETDNVSDTDHFDDTEATDTNSGNSTSDSDGDSAHLNSAETSDGQEQPTIPDTQDEILDTLTATSYNSVPSGGGAVEKTAAGNGIIDNKLEKAVDPLEAFLETDLFYAVADETEITYHVTAEGGKAPYYYIFRATVDDKVVCEMEDDFEGSSSETEITYTPDRCGMLEAEIIVMDEEDDAASAVRRIAVSAPEKETEQDWKRSTKSAKLTGDWRKDLIRVAATQLGYTESRKDFTVDDDAVMHRYSRYGAWYEEAAGTADEEISYRYMDWDTMFISFCMSYAKIEEDFFKPAASFDTWEEQLTEADAYREAGSGYVPEPGDLIIFNEEDRPEHTGIVETVSEEDAQVVTIEGDALAADASGEVSLIDDLDDTKATEENTSESDTADTKASEETEAADDAKAETKASEETEAAENAKAETKASEETEAADDAKAETKASEETKAADDASAETKVSVETETGDETVETKASREEKETEAESSEDIEIVIEKETSEAEDLADTDNVKADEAESLVEIIDEDDEIIEADERDTVVRSTYSLDDDRIVGYVSMRAMMEAAGLEVIDGEVLESEDGTVRVIGDFPENTTLEVTPLTEENYEQYLGKDVAERMASYKGTLYFAYDITIRNEDGTEWQPDKDHPVKVKIALDQIPEKEMEVLHITDEGAAEQVEADTDTKDSSVSFDADGFSVYMAGDEELLSVASLDDTNGLTSEDGRIQITGSLPTGATLEATALTTENYNGNMSEAMEKRLNSSTVSPYAVYDITIKDADTEKWQPAEDDTVKVSVTLDSEPDSSLVVLHDSSSGIEVVDNVEVEDKVVTFPVKGFSVYALIENSLTSKDGLVSVRGSSLPEGATLTVTEVNSDAYATYMNSTMAKRLTTYKKTYAKDPYAVYDIKILKDGTEWQPSSDNPVTVSITLTQALSEAVVVLHDGGTVNGKGVVEELADTVKNITGETEDDTESRSVVTFSTTGFSYFAIIDAKELAGQYTLAQLALHDLKLIEEESKTGFTGNEHTSSPLEGESDSLTMDYEQVYAALIQKVLEGGDKSASYKIYGDIPTGIQSNVRTAGSNINDTTPEGTNVWVVYGEVNLTGEIKITDARMTFGGKTIHDAKNRLIILAGDKDAKIKADTSGYFSVTGEGGQCTNALSLQGNKTSSLCYDGQGSYSLDRTKDNDGLTTGVTLTLDNATYARSNSAINNKGGLLYTNYFVMQNFSMNKQAGSNTGIRLDYGDNRKMMYMANSLLQRYYGNEYGMLLISAAAAGNSVGSNAPLSKIYMYQTEFNECMVNGQGSDYGGGAIRSYAVNTASMYLNQCTFENNVSNNQNGSMGGGAIRWHNAASIGNNTESEAVINNCTFSGNYAYGPGGAILNCGNMEILGGTFQKNFSSDSGGAICASTVKVDGELDSLQNNGISRNLILDEGAILTKNKAVNYGGGLCFDVSQGYYVSEKGKKNIPYSSIGITLKDTEISDNSACYGGGGAMYLTYDYQVSVEIQDKAVISNNRALKNDNVGGNGGGICLASIADTYKQKQLFEITGGSVTGNLAENNGGGIYINVINTINDNPNDLLSKAASTQTAYDGFWMLGGVIGAEDSPNTAENGGGVYIENGLATMTGGMINYNMANNHGGGIAVVGNRNKKQLNTVVLSEDKNNDADSDGIMISNNTASKGNGGGLYVDYANVEMSGGTIEGNKAQPDKSPEDSSTDTTKDGADDDLKSALTITDGGNGGGIYITEGSFNVSGGIVQKNKALYDGGGVCVHNGSATMSPIKNETTDAETTGVISENTAGRNGGGIAIDSNDAADTTSSEYVVDVEGVEIRDNTAESGNGGGVYAHNSNFVLKDGTVTGNKAINWDVLNKITRGNGGGIYVRKGTFTMYGGEVSRNETSRFGGGIYVYGDQTSSSSGNPIQLYGGTISYNKAGQCGGGVTAYYTDITLGISDIAGTTDTAGVRIVSNEAVEGGGLYLRYSSDLTMTGGYIRDNHAVSLQNKGGWNDDFYEHVYGAQNTSLVFMGDDKNDFGGNGGGIFIENSKMTLNGNTSRTGSGDITDNSADRNGGGIYALHTADAGTISDTSENTENTDPVYLEIENGSISRNTAGRHGGGIAMFALDCYLEKIDANNRHGHAQANINGSVSIANNQAANGGAFYVGGGELTVNGGIIRVNKAVGMPENSVKTAYNPNDNVGVGGGIYVYETGTLILDTVKSGSTTNNSDLKLGVYDNEAEFAADDIYCSPLATSEITLPEVHNMYLKDYSQRVIGRAINWFEDYPTNDEQYSKRYIPLQEKTQQADEPSGISDEDFQVRYREAKTEAQKVIYTVNANNNIESGYLCLTLGYTYYRVNLVVKKEVPVDYTGGNSKFNFTAYIEGSVDQRELEANLDTAAVNAVIFEGTGYTIENSTATSATVTFSLGDGDSVTLQGIPVNANVVITENNATGYNTSYVWDRTDTVKTVTGSTFSTYDLGTNLGTNYSQVTCKNLISFENTVDIELLAQDSSNPDSVVFDLTSLETVKGSNQFIPQELLAGQTFNIVSRQILNEDGSAPGDWVLANIDSVDENKTTAGYNYANRNFGIEMAIGTEKGSGKTYDPKDLKTTSTFTFPDSGAIKAVDGAKLTFILHNANAITQGNSAGIYRIMMTSENGGKLTFNIKINRKPAQIHATVPLYVCMYGYGGDGKVVTPSQETYGISNWSDFPVQITSVAGTHTNGGWELKDSAAGLKAGELFLRLANQVITSETKDTSGDSLWRIGASEASETNGRRLSIPISAAIAGGSVNEDGESKVCHVTYTCEIPEY